MGTPSNQTTGSQVYYDPEKQQYYTINQQEQSNPMQGIIYGMSPFKEISAKNRNYITIPSMVAADRFTPKTVEPIYPEMNMLFPALNAGLAQNLQNSLLAPTDNTQSSGAGRFLAPSTSKGK